MIVTVQEPTHGAKCGLFARAGQSFFTSRSAGMSFSQVHCVASRSYLTCQNEFRGTFPDSPVPNKLTVWWTVSVTQELFTVLHEKK
jgi:hypothetical protein